MKINVHNVPELKGKSLAHLSIHVIGGSQHESVADGADGVSHFIERRKSNDK